MDFRIRNTNGQAKQWYHAIAIVRYIPNVVYTVTYEHTDIVELIMMWLDCGSGDNCQLDLDGCQDNPCTEGTNCTDVTPVQHVATGGAYNCSQCPAGTEENDGICLREYEVLTLTFHGCLQRLRLQCFRLFAYRQPGLRRFDNSFSVKSCFMIRLPFPILPHITISILPT